MPGSAPRCTGRWSRCGRASPSSASRAAAPPPRPPSSTAWAIQLSACWALLYALGLNGQAGIGAAAAVLFAVNVTAVVPATPSNIGVFQLAVISVLHTGFGIGTADALAYGVILQAVEIATAVALGLPALVREGLTWSDLRVQALSAAPVRLDPLPRTRRDASDRHRSPDTGPVGGSCRRGARCCCDSTGSISGGSSPPRSVPAISSSGPCPPG